MMRPRRRRTRGPRPETPGATESSFNDTAPDASFEPPPPTPGPVDYPSAPPPASYGGEGSAPGAPPSYAGGTPVNGPGGDLRGPGSDMRGSGGDLRGRRRRRRGRSGGGPRPMGMNNGQTQGGAPNYDRPRGDNPNRGRDRDDQNRRGRRRRGRGNDAPVRNRRRGLETLKELQHAGAALDPTERLILELPPGEGSPPYGDRTTGRAIDLIAPIGRGQRCLLVAPPKAGKTRILQCIAASIAHNHPDVKVYALLVDERPEEVTDFRRNTPAEVIAASSDMTVEEHIETAERAMELVAQQVMEGKDVVLLLDSITRLARAYNAAAGNGGRTMSGGLDSNAMQAPRQIFGAARKIENGGSLTIIGTALIDTGSRMDQIIFEEFKGTGNSEIYLSRELAERRIFPAIDIAKTGTRKDEKLIPPEQLQTFTTLRRVLLQMPLQEAMSKLVDRLGKTKTNEEFFALVRVGDS